MASSADSDIALIGSGDPSASEQLKVAAQPAGDATVSLSLPLRPVAHELSENGFPLKKKRPPAGGLDFCISVVRSCILALVGGGGLVVLLVLINIIHIRPDTHQFEGELAVDFCTGSTGAVLSVTPNGSMTKSMEQGAAQIMSFHIDGGGLPEIMPHFLPDQLTYYMNQRERQHDPWIHMALSFYYFRQKRTRFVFKLLDEACFSSGNYSQLVGNNSAEKESVINAFGASLYAALEEAGKLREQGDFLVREDIEALWNPETGRFDAALSAAAPWVAHAYLGTFVLLVLILVFLHIVWFVFGFASMWSEEVDNHIEQYDHFRDDPTVHSRKYMLHSMFFVLDHVHGDKYVNAEQWDKAVVSSLIHAVACILYAALPAAFAIFVPDAKIPITIVISLYVIFQLTSGIGYYFSTLRERHAWMVVGELFFSGVLVLLTLLYWNAVVVFLLTSIVDDPDEVISLLVPLISVFLYAILTYSFLKTFQEDLKSAASGNETKGRVFSILQQAGLDNVGIVLFVLTSVIALLFLAALLWLTCALTAGADSVSNTNRAPAVVMPIAACATSVGEVVSAYKTRKKQVNELYKGP